MSAPATVLVMRHAEKLADVANPHLSPAGEARATALAAYIPTTFWVPDFIFATMISKHSARPIETVTPLSQQTGVAINSDLADQEYGVLARDLLTDATYAGKHVLVCWHHGNIPPMLRALGAAVGTYSDPWDPPVFNLILKLDYGSVGAPDVSKIVEPF
jgi:hypothetical protein